MKTDVYTGGNEILQFDYVVDITVGPGVVILKNTSGAPIAVLGTAQLVAIVQRENDTNIALPAA